MVEVDETYINASDKGELGSLRAHRQRGRGTYDTKRPPVIGFVERGKDFVMVVSQNVKSRQIKELVQTFVDKGGTLFTDEYRIYDRLKRWGYEHRRVEHAKGEYANDLIHTNTIECIWSLLKPALMIHRGVSRKKLFLYVAWQNFRFRYYRFGVSIIAKTFLSLVLQPITTLNAI